MTACELDHIIIGAASLEQGAAFIRERLGVEIGSGGKHPDMGTHNRLMRLGETAFLEVISIDPDAPPPTRPRWFKLDDPAMRSCLAECPRLLSWAVRSPDVVAAAKLASYDPGEVLSLRRDALTWRLTVPAEGRIPGDGVLPHIIQWDDGLRPWERMAERDCRLKELVITHPRPEDVEIRLQSIGAMGTIPLHVKQGPEPRLAASIGTAGGTIVVLE
jgi:hypothetical protein